MATLFSACLILLATSVAAITVPTDAMDHWTGLSYRDIPPNVVTASGDGLHIAVRQSSSPLVFKLKAPLAVTGFKLKARWSGELAVPAGAVQGDKDADDFVLKFGLVEAGDQTLNWFQRRIAADWVKRLFALAPEGSGVSRINFFSTTRQQELLGSRRSHPLNDVLHETRIRYLAEPGPFEMSQMFPEPVETLGLWISTDGDDTHSTFDLYIESIELQTSP